VINPVLYATTALLWGTTWLPITLHFGVVAPPVSLAYRLWIAAGVLMLWCVVRGDNLSYPKHAHFRFAQLGLFLFSLNYLLLYLGQVELTSGLIAVIFSMLSVLNTINSALFLGRAIEARMVGAALLGVSGLALVFADDLRHLGWSQLASVGLALAGTYSASVGNIMSARSQTLGLPVLQANAWGMAYGAIFMTLFSAATGLSFNFEMTLRYVGALLYLAVFGSIIGFGCYLTLIGRIGAARAGYVSVMFPLVALTLSTWFEDYRWTPTAVLGTVLVLAGNLIVLMPRRTREVSAASASGGGT